MKLEEFATLVKAMKAVYSDPKFIADADAIMVWYEFFKEDDYMVVQTAIKKYMANNEYPPTIAGIRKSIGEITNPNISMTEGEAWSLVYKAICNSNYNAKEEFEKLPKECQKAVGSPGMLREWAGLEVSEVNTVIQSNFMRSYKVEQKRSREMQMLPPSTRNVIEKLASGMNMNGRIGTVKEDSSHRVSFYDLPDREEDFYDEPEDWGE